MLTFIFVSLSILEVCVTWDYKRYRMDSSFVMPCLNLSPHTCRCLHRAVTVSIWTRPMLTEHLR